MQDFSSDLQLAITAAKAAGEIIKAGYGQIKSIEVKEEGRKGIVTNVDKESEEAILNILRSKSNYAIFSEETGNIDGKDALWVIDPIDGTTNFSRNIPFFCVSIALMKTTGTDSGQVLRPRGLQDRGARMTEKNINNGIVLGVIYNPVLDDLYFAEKDKGAYLNEKIIHVSKQESLKGSVVITTHGYNLEDRKRAVEVTKILYKDCSLRRFGTTALELCFVAKGGADAFMCSGDELYDYAAGLIITEEAGGKVTDWKGNAWNNTNSFILATNGKIHDEIVVEVKDLQ